MIINTSYFINELAIPNIGANTPIETGNQTRLQRCIDVYEREVLIYGLGRQLYEEFISNIDQNPLSVDYGNLILGANVIWERLLLGYTYTIGSTDYYWNGLRYTIETSANIIYKSLIAYYVYAKYVEQNVSNLTDLGVVAENAKNADLVSPSPKIVYAWREFYKMYGTNEWNYNRLFASPVYELLNVTNTGEVSLFKFLIDNRSDYSTWRFTQLDNKNSFGI